MSKTTTKKKCYDWSWSLLRNTELQELYTVTVCNRYTKLSNNSDNITEQYGKFVKANAESADKLIPIRKKAKRRNIADKPRIDKARREVQDAYVNYQKDANTDSQLFLQKKKEDLQQEYQDIQEKDLDEMIQVANAQPRPQRFFSLQKLRKNGFFLSILSEFL